ncbi:hypothetical protein SLS60_008287 [Paraconiothyrium brasiliense]|uniref:Uncharacterized protein n=1 Tax=Paraconiothyrium brasiliense TaxID=300254 RepID=A0ABR3R046_9PLEO
MFVRTALLSLSALVAAKELPKDEVKGAQLYDSGIKHANNVALKRESWAKHEANGVYASEQYAEIADFVACSNGTAKSGTDTFRCKNVSFPLPWANPDRALIHDQIDLYHFLSHSALGSTKGFGSSSWGWTSSDGREFVAIGQSDGTAFAEITKAGKLSYLGRLPQFSTPSEWREIRGHNDFVIIGSEASNHGIQIFDWKKLLTIDPAKPVTFTNTVGGGLVGHYDKLPSGRTHNVVTNPKGNYIYSVGAQPRTDACKSGIIFIDISTPSKPTNAGYTLTIYDITDKKAPVVLSRTSYTGASYTHQGALLDVEDQRYLLLDDEYDEYDKTGPGAAGNPITYIWDISSLKKPKQTGLYKSGAKGIDHNQYVSGGFAYQSNYGTGFRVLDVSSIPSDPTGAGVKEVGFFDIYPEDDNQAGGGVIDFVGTWSSYALFKSGYILVNTMERGAFILKKQAGAF